MRFKKYYTVKRSEHFGLKQSGGKLIYFKKERRNLIYKNNCN